MDAGAGDAGERADAATGDAGSPPDGGSQSDGGTTADGGSPVGTGHVVLIGSNLSAADLDTYRLVVNSVLLTGREGTIDILEYDTFADTDPAASAGEIHDAIVTFLEILARPYTFTSGAPTPANLADADVVLIYEQDLLDGTNRPTWRDTTAPGWNADLNGFVDAGGVVIALDGFGVTYEAVKGPGLFTIPLHVRNTAAFMEVLEPTDPVVSMVPSSYPPPGSSLQFPGATGGTVVVQAGGAPHVLHQTRVAP